jgi:hypothetical protein
VDPSIREEMGFENSREKKSCIKRSALEMFVVGFVRKIIYLKTGTPSPCTRLPVVDPAGFRDPGRNSDAQVVGKGIDIRFVHPAKL